MFSNPFKKKASNTSVQAEDPRTKNKSVPFQRANNPWKDDGDDETKAKSSSLLCCLFKTKNKKPAPLDSALDFEALPDPNKISTRNKYK